MEQTNGNLALLPLKSSPAPAEWDTPDKLALLRDTYAKGLSQAEFGLFIEHCRQLDLNPLTKQVQPIKFDGKTLSFHTTLHGLVAIACRSGGYAGMDPVRFDVYPKGDSLGSQHPNTASATVWKIVQGQRVAFSAEVFWVERNRGQASWKVQPFSMLGKCAQAAAIRLGFEETKGLYIEEELPNTVEGTVVTEQPRQAAPVKEAEPEFLPPQGKTWQTWCHEMAKETGLFDDKAQYLEFLFETTEKPTDQKYSAQDYARVAHRLQEMLWEVKQAESEKAEAEENTVDAAD